MIQEGFKVMHKKKYIKIKKKIDDIMTLYFQLPNIWIE